MEDAKKLLGAGADVNGANPDGTTASDAGGGGSATCPTICRRSRCCSRRIRIWRRRNGPDGALSRGIGGQGEHATRCSRKGGSQSQASDGSRRYSAAVTYGRCRVKGAAGGRGQCRNRGQSRHDAADAGGRRNGLHAQQRAVRAGAARKGRQGGAQDKQGRSALFLASTEGKTDAVNLLLDPKADPNQKDNNGATPLQGGDVRQDGDREDLLKRGATVDAADSSGNTPLMVQPKAAPTFRTTAHWCRCCWSRREGGAAGWRGRTAFYRAARKARGCHPAAARAEGRYQSEAGGWMTPVDRRGVERANWRG